MKNQYHQRSADRYQSIKKKDNNQLYSIKNTLNFQNLDQVTNIQLKTIIEKLINKSKLLIRSLQNTLKEFDIVKVQRDYWKKHYFDFKTACQQYIQSQGLKKLQTNYFFPKYQLVSDENNKMIQFDKPKFTGIQFRENSVVKLKQYKDSSKKKNSSIHQKTIKTLDFTVLQQQPNIVNSVKIINKNNSQDTSATKIKQNYKRLDSLGTKKIKLFKTKQLN